MGQNIKTLIDEIKANMDSYNQNEYFAGLRNSMNGGTFEANIDEHYLSQDIDLNWLQLIENTVIPLDNIIRDPRRFIKNDEEVVQIEFAKGITTDSIKHLAQHTNMIANVEDDMITPQKILNVRKEESFDTYENRFIKTLLAKVQYLLDKRMNVINEKANVDNEYHLTYSGSFVYGSDNVEYQFNLNYVSPNKTKKEDLSELIKADVTNLSSVQRIERLRKIFYDFQTSAFARSVANCSMIKPPLTMTNILTKNPNFRACVDLWTKIDQSSSTGLKLNVVTRSEAPDANYSDELANLAALSYLSLKSHTSEINDVAVGKINEFVVKERIEQMIDSYEFNLDEIKRVFIDKIQSKEKHLKALERRMIDIIKEAISDEDNYKKERKINELKDFNKKKKSSEDNLPKETKKKKETTSKSTKKATSSKKSEKLTEREIFERERAKYWKKVKKLHLKRKKFVLETTEKTDK